MIFSANIPPALARVRTWASCQSRQTFYYSTHLVPTTPPSSIPSCDDDSGQNIHAITIAIHVCIISVRQAPCLTNKGTRRRLFTCAGGMRHTITPRYIASRQRGTTTRMDMATLHSLSAMSVGATLPPHLARALTIPHPSVPHGAMQKTGKTTGMVCEGHGYRSPKHARVAAALQLRAAGGVVP